MSRFLTMIFVFPMLVCIGCGNSSDFGLPHRSDFTSSSSEVTFLDGSWRLEAVANKNLNFIVRIADGKGYFVDARGVESGSVFLTNIERIDGTSFKATRLVGKGKGKGYYETGCRFELIDEFSMIENIEEFDGDFLVYYDFRWKRVESFEDMQIVNVGFSGSRRKLAKKSIVPTTHGIDVEVAEYLSFAKSIKLVDSSSTTVGAEIKLGADQLASIAGRINREWTTEKGLQLISEHGSERRLIVPGDGSTYIAKVYFKIRDVTIYRKNGQPELRFEVVEDIEIEIEKSAEQ